MNYLVTEISIFLENFNYIRLTQVRILSHFTKLYFLENFKTTF